MLVWSRPDINSKDCRGYIFSSLIQECNIIDDLNHLPRSSSNTQNHKHSQSSPASDADVDHFSHPFFAQPTSHKMSSAANPNAPQPGSASTDPSIPQEPTGPLASDSLAAESVQAGGGFADNDNVNISGVSGEASTFNNTDTSGATTLPPAPSAGQRDADDGVKYPQGDPPPQFTGTTTSQGYSGGPTAGREVSGYQTAAGGASATGSLASTSIEQAPTYTNIVNSPLDPTNAKPKGTNLGDESIPETETEVGDVDGKNDPGRVAVQDMLRRNAGMAGEGVGGVRHRQEEGSSGQFDVLGDEGADRQGIDQ